MRSSGAGWRHDVRESYRRGSALQGTYRRFAQSAARGRRPVPRSQLVTEPSRLPLASSAAFAVITPAKDEELNLQRLASCMTCQTARPGPLDRRKRRIDRFDTTRREGPRDVSCRSVDPSFTTIQRAGGGCLTCIHEARRWRFSSSSFAGAVTANAALLASGRREGSVTSWLRGPGAPRAADCAKRL